MYKYRSEYFSGSGERRIKEVIKYETAELDNTDIWEYCLSHYALSEKTKSLANAVIASIDECFLLDDGVLKEAINLLIDDLTALLGWEPKYCIWLADFNNVIRQYDIPTTKCQVSDVILSDLATDGVLYAYSEPPKEIIIDGTEFDRLLSETKPLKVLSYE